MDLTLCTMYRWDGHFYGYLQFIKVRVEKKRSNAYLPVFFKKYFGFTLSLRRGRIV